MVRGGRHVCLAIGMLEALGPCLAGGSRTVVYVPRPGLRFVIPPGWVALHPEPEVLSPPQFPALARIGTLRIVRGSAEMVVGYQVFRRGGSKRQRMEASVESMIRRSSIIRREGRRRGMRIIEYVRLRPLANKRVDEVRGVLFIGRRSEVDITAEARGVPAVVRTRLEGAAAALAMIRATLVMSSGLVPRPRRASRSPRRPRAAESWQRPAGISASGVRYRETENQDPPGCDAN